MPAPTSLAGQIEEWCREAIAEWGDDWQKISEYIGARYAELDEGEKRRLEGEAAITLAWTHGMSNHSH
jgi:hypothetical protein